MKTSKILLLLQNTDPDIKEIALKILKMLSKK